MKAAFSVPAFRFSIGTLDTAIGKWSRGATYGDKSAKGDGLTFTPEILTRMVENVEARGDKVSVCQDHKSAYVATTGQPAPSLGYFYGLAVFADGKLVKHWAYDGGAPPPPVDESGKPRDGLYCRLGEITPLGMDPTQGLANYGFLSPMFQPDGQAENGAQVGYSLIDFGATSTPFQAGCEIQFSNGVQTMADWRNASPDNPVLVLIDSSDGRVTDLPVPPGSKERDRVTVDGKQYTVYEYRGPGGHHTPGRFLSDNPGAAGAPGAMNMNEEMLKKLGLAADADGPAKMAALKKFANDAMLGAGAIDAARCGTMADDLEAFAEIADEEQKASMKALAGMFRKMAGAGGEPMAHEEPDGDEVPPDMAALAMSLGVDVKGKKRAQVMDAITASAVPASKVVEMSRVAAKEVIEAEKAAVRAEENKRKAEVLMASLPASVPQANRDAIKRVADRDPDEAHLLAQPWLPKDTGAPAYLFGRMTSQGGPVGQPGAREMAGPKQPTIHETPIATFLAPDEELADEIKAVAFSQDPATVAKVRAHLANPKEDHKAALLIAAERVVKAERPYLFESAKRTAIHFSR